MRGLVVYLAVAALVTGCASRPRKPQHTPELCAAGLCPGHAKRPPNPLVLLAKSLTKKRAQDAIAARAAEEREAQEQERAALLRRLELESRVVVHPRPVQKADPATDPYHAALIAEAKRAEAARLRDGPSPEVQAYYTSVLQAQAERAEAARAAEEERARQREEQNAQAQAELEVALARQRESQSQFEAQALAARQAKKAKKEARRAEIEYMFALARERQLVSLQQPRVQTVRGIFDLGGPRYRVLPPLVAENGDVYGADNDGDGRVETVYVGGYWRADGIYVRGHYRAQ